MSDDKRIKVVAPAGHEFVEEVIRSCGLDPATATAHDMDGADAFFVCESCCNESQPLYVMRWRAAMASYSFADVLLCTELLIHNRTISGTLSRWFVSLIPSSFPLPNVPKNPRSKLVSLTHILMTRPMSVFIAMS